MQATGQLDPTEPFMMSGFLKPDAKHIFDSDFNFSSAPRSKLNRLLERAGVSGGPFHHLRIASVMFGRYDSDFVGFASVPVELPECCAFAPLGSAVRAGNCHIRHLTEFRGT
jgi:hypothetical protein